MGSVSSVKKVFNPIQGKPEKQFLEFAKKHPDNFIHALPNAPIEGFEDHFSKQGGGMIQMMKRRSAGMSFRNRMKIIGTFVRYLRGNMKGRNRAFTDLQPYLQAIEDGTFQANGNSKLETYPNNELWEELNQYAHDKFGYVKIGFTKLPQHLIFRGKAVLYPYALVFMEEMHKKEIDTAPELEAGREVIRVYSTLGKAVNDIAQWLRSEGIRCQSNHPLGGLVNTPPLAGKAGMGGQGANGLLITPEFGQRQRLAPIFVEEKIFEFTDNHDHDWIEAFCDQCQICVKKCPMDAIYEQRIDLQVGVEGIGKVRTCIDNEKCFPYFEKTLGCSICVKVCPFSPGPESYTRLKQTLENKMNAKIEL